VLRSLDSLPPPAPMSLMRGGVPMHAIRARYYHQAGNGSPIQGLSTIAI